MKYVVVAVAAAIIIIITIINGLIDNVWSCVNILNEVIYLVIILYEYWIYYFWIQWNNKISGVWSSFLF